MPYKKNKTFNSAELTKWRQNYFLMRAVKEWLKDGKKTRVKRRRWWWFRREWDTAKINENKQYLTEAIEREFND